MNINYFNLTAKLLDLTVTSKATNKDAFSEYDSKIYKYSIPALKSKLV